MTEENKKPEASDEERRGQRYEKAANDAEAVTDEHPDLKEESLLGSTRQPSTFKLFGGQEVQLGEVVREAYKRSGLTVEQWNGLSDENRETAISAVVSLLNIDLGTAGAQGKEPMRRDQVEGVILKHFKADKLEEISEQKDLDGIGAITIYAVIVKGGMFSKSTTAAIGNLSDLYAAATGHQDALERVILASNGRDNSGF